MFPTTIAVPKKILATKSELVKSFSRQLFVINGNHGIRQRNEKKFDKCLGGSCFRSIRVYDRPSSIISSTDNWYRSFTCGNNTHFSADDPKDSIPGNKKRTPFEGCSSDSKCTGKLNSSLFYINYCPKLPLSSLYLPWCPMIADT